MYYCTDAKKWYTEDLMDNDHSSNFSSIEEVSNRGESDPYRCTEIVDSDKGIIIIIIINYYVGLRMMTTWMTSLLMTLK